MRRIGRLLVIAVTVLSAVNLLAQERDDRRGDDSRGRSGFGRRPYGGGRDGFRPEGGGFRGFRPEFGPPGGFRPEGGGPGGFRPGMGPGGGPPGTGFRGGGPPGMGFRGGGPPGMGFRGGGPPGMGPPTDGRTEDRASRFEAFLRSMDTNGNGILEPSEIPEERRRMFGFLASRAGLNPDQPVEISRIREAMTRRYSRPGDDSRAGEEGSSRKSADEEEPLVPGFGVDQELARVPEFGERVEGSPAAAAGSSASRSGERRGGGRFSSRSSRSSSSDSDRRREVEERVRRFAPYIMRRYDTNGNGVLEKEEWGQMREDPSPADRNHDGVLTAEEFTAALVQRSMGRYGGSESSSSTAGGSAASGSTSSNGRKSYRFLTPRERLPEGLPSWFTDYDANEDGQVAMAEYSRYWTDLKAREFQRYDLNGDGLITPRECLNAAATVAGGMDRGGEVPREPLGPEPSRESGGGSESKGWWE